MEAGQPTVGASHLPLRVGFDGRDLLRKRTGVVNYTVHLAQALSREQDLALTIYVDGFRDPAVSPPPHLTLRRISGPPGFWKHVTLPAVLMRDSARLVHSPTGTLPLWSPCPGIVTIHDLFPAIDPRWFPGAMGRRLNAAQCRSARTARMVLTVSERTRQDVIRHYGVPAERVRVVYNGVDHRRFGPSALGEDAAKAVAARFGVHRPYALCVGSLMPWRNAPRLLQAIATLRARHQVPLDLLFVGRDIWGTDPTAAIARERGWDTWCHFAGYASDADLSDLYGAADVFAYPSLYEGFGIPPVEALACGLPVVASNAGAIPEVLGSAALLVNPLDVDALAAALLAAVTDQQVRARLRLEGPPQAQRYSWKRAAAETAAAYREALS